MIGGVLVFGGSSRTHTLRVHQRDALQLLEAQHAALTAQLAALEKEAADPASLFGLLPKALRARPFGPVPRPFGPGPSPQNN